MLKAVVAGVFGAVAFGNVALATCPAPPFVNGTTADATAVNNALGCLAPLDTPNFTGDVLLTDSSPTGAASFVAKNDLATLGELVSTMYGSTITGTIFGIPRANLAAVQTGQNNASGAALVVGTRNSGNLYLGTNNAVRVTVDTTGNVGIGTTTPAQALEVSGEVQIDTLASATSTTLCLSPVGASVVLASCSSSIRYKENVKDASFGLNEVMSMRPVTFKWRGRDENDIGLIAEEVGKINPLFVTYKDGRIEGVKYGQLTAVLVNAVKELKADNDKQRALNDLQKMANDRQASQIAQLQRAVAALQHRSDRRTANR